MPLTTSLVGVEILVEKYWVVFWKKIHLLPRKRWLRPYSKKKNMRFSRVFQSTIGRSRCRSSSNSSTSRINYIYENTHTLSLSLFYAERIYSHIHLSFAEIFSSLSIETASSYFFYLTYQKGYYIHIGRV